MFFSILIPVYQVERYLRQCVDSVLGQSEKEYEIVLVDDGSTDGSGAICDEYAARYPDIVRVIHQENKGLLLARRTAIRAARGEWFVHLDSDDYMLPGALRAIRETAERNGADLVLCKAAYGNEDGVEILRESDLPFADNETFPDKKKLLMQFLYGGQLTAIYQKIARRDIVDIDGDYERWKHVNIMEDHLQSLPLLDRCSIPVFLDKAVVYYRINRGGMTQQKSFDALVAGFRSVRDVYAEEETYRVKWALSKEENGLVCAKHMRKYCLSIQDLYRSAADPQERNSFLRSVREDEIIQKDFLTADRKAMGKKSRLCFQMICHGWFSLLRLLFAVER